MQAEKGEQREVCRREKGTGLDCGDPDGCTGSQTPDVYSYSSATGL